MSTLSPNPKHVLILDFSSTLDVFVHSMVQVTEDEFVSAASHEPKLVMFAQSVVDQCLDMHPDLTSAVDRARATYLENTKGGSRVRSCTSAQPTHPIPYCWYHLCRVLPTHCVVRT